MNAGMTPEERRALEQRADRATRRGELAEAFSALKQLAAAWPDDAGLQQRLAEFQASLQPAELMSAKAHFAAEPSAPQSEADRAERLAAQGNYRDAIAIYRQLIAQRPDADLLKERLAELFQLAQVTARPSAPQPVDRATALNDMLERITSRRRK